MKKFLSMVLALVMTMSLVTVSVGAKEFTDDATITYDEAIAVISTIGVVDGYEDGSFNPTNNLTRQAAAKIICNLVLGPTTAAALVADAAPFPDVPTSNPMSGYIAYCAQQGIINGYPDGTFKPGNSLTGYAFMKMLLGALGYDSAIEGYTGDNWTVAVAKRAIGIGLEDGLEGEFNGTKTVNREEACLYAFNTLQADLVEYDTKITTTVNGQTVTIGNDLATSRKWGTDSQRTRINNIREDDIIQFAEEYFRKLEKKLGTDDFERPAYTWIYDKEEIGTFVDWSLMVGEYDTGVTGREMYDLLGEALLNDDDMDLTYYFNGVQPEANCGLDPVWVLGHADDGRNDITKTNGVLRRSNQNDIGYTDDGVLTQVFVDKDVREEIIIVSINTWLAEGGSDYSEDREFATLEVWTSENTDPDRTFDVDVVDVPEVVDVAEDTRYLVNISFKNDLDDGEIVVITEPEILEDSAVTKFSLDDVDNPTQVPTKVTVAGTEYKKAARGYYDPDALDQYNETLLTNRAYNVFLDEFGYMIGIELNEGADNYLFITGFDRPASNRAIKTADANAIFLDGTMAEIKVNVTDTDDNIRDARNNVTLAQGKDYFIPWQNIVMLSGQDGFHVLNRWYTYTVTDAGVYTLKPAARMIAYKNSTAETIKTANLYLDDNIMFNATGNGVAGNPYNLVNTDNGLIGSKFAFSDSPTDTIATGYAYTAANNARCYGNDDSVYITVETDIVDYLSTSTGTISDVTGVYTGVQNVEIEIDPADITPTNSDRHLDEAYIYAVYDKNNYIIGAVTVGEGNGGNATIAYVTEGVKSERIEDGFYYWEFEAIVDGKLQTLTVKEKYDKVLGANGSNRSVINAEGQRLYRSPLAQSSTTNWNAYDGIVELRMDADGYVVGVKSVAEKDIYSYFGNKYAGHTNAFKGGNSLVTSPNDYSEANWNVDELKIGDAKAYRMGVIAAGDEVPAGKTWANANADTSNHHYDSAPEVLTLVGRTLYVTADTTNGGTNPSPSDEGLALASDCKFFVIQQENGKWKTREYSSASAAIAQVKDSDDYTSGKQFTNGEIVALLKNAQAHSVILISHENIVSGGGNTNTTNLTGITVIGGGNGYSDPNIVFDLLGTTANKNYTVTLQRLGFNETEWKNISSKTFKTSAVGGTENFTWAYGTLPGFYSYRLVCGSYTSEVF